MTFHYDVRLKYRKRTKCCFEKPSLGRFPLNNTTIAHSHSHSTKNDLRPGFNISSIQNSMTDTGRNTSTPQGLAICYEANWTRWQRVPPPGFRVRYSRLLYMRAAISKPAYSNPFSMFISGSRLFHAIHVTVLKLNMCLRLRFYSPSPQVCRILFLSTWRLYNLTVRNRIPYIYVITPGFNFKISFAVTVTILFFYL